MAKKMEEGAGLSLQQRKFLAVVLREPFILQNFYLTGGTALSYWYLHHRQSDDLDFFTEKPFFADQVTAWIKSQQSEIGFRWMGEDGGWQFRTYTFRFPGNSRFKVDFGRYSGERLKKSLVWKGLEIDSLYDIAVNKAHLFSLTPRERDYIDLYYILKNTPWSMQKLLAAAKTKFNTDFNIVTVVQNFYKVAEISEVPKMLVPFDQKEMEKFFTDLAKSLKNKILTS